MPRRLIVLALAAAFLLVPAAARAASPDIVISQVYGGGGNTGATYTNDFVELYNRGSAAVSVDGWSVQYASAAGGTWQVTPLSGSIAPGRHYLVQEAAGSGGTDALPDPEATGSIALAAGSGKVALVTDIAKLTCSTACAAKDLVGYGSASAFETAPTPALSNTTAALRKRSGAQDTDDNSADFTVGGPDPRNGSSATIASSDPAEGATGVPVGTTIHVTFAGPVTVDPSGVALTCAGEPQAVSVTQDAEDSATIDPQADLPAGARCTLTVAGARLHFSTPPLTLRIHDIQGAAHRSPYEGRLVGDVPGIVTAVGANGFWMQDPRPDRSVSTSEGIFVFGPTGIAVGDAVTVSGAVQEFRPANDPNNLTTTEIGSPTVTKTGAGSITPTIVGSGGRRPPMRVYEDDANGDVEVPNVLFDPREDGLDFDESLEGMLVQINHPDVVGPLANTFGELPVVERDSASPRTPRGGVLVRPNDFNPERMMLDDEIIKPSGGSMPAANVGDRLAGPVRAVVDYAFGEYMFEVTAPPARIDRGLKREVTQAPGKNELAAASINLENLSAVSPADKFARLAEIVVTNLRSPDILAVEEMQDNDGAPAEGDSDATQTFERFIAAVAAAGGPHYQYRQINPVPGEDGGEPGGNIRVGFLFRTDRGLDFVDRPGGDATTATMEDAARPGAQLTLSPGRVDPANPAWENSRKPLAAEFDWRGTKVFAIANHFNSKGGDQPLEGRFQPPERSSEVQRHQQATVLAGFVRSIERADRRARIVVMGDFNDFDFSQTLKIVRGGGLENLMDTLPVKQRYSYVFEGNSQVLDQILVSPELARTDPEYDSVHVNAEFADQASDHDPQITRIKVR